MKRETDEQVAAFPIDEETVTCWVRLYYPEIEERCVAYFPVPIPTVTPLEINHVRWQAFDPKHAATLQPDFRKEPPTWSHV